MIMNPPFTSNTAKETMHIGIFAPAFAAFESIDKDQRDMAKHLSKLRKGTCYHGHAGMASAFAALAERKLKPGGVLALVLPLTASAASSWRAFRQMMAQDFTEFTVLSIAANGREMSFSSDTGIAECLVVARKLRMGEPPRGKYKFASLRRKPQNFSHARFLASELADSNQARAIEDGPYGGTPMLVGEELAGEVDNRPSWPQREESGARCG